MSLNELTLIGEQFIDASWPFFLFFLLFPFFEQTWIRWRNILYDISTQRVVLELLIPREIRKNPRAMEQVLMTLHSLRNAPSTFLEKWWEGEFTLSFSLEVVSVSGEIHFYVRVPKKHKPLIEAAFFSYYPDVEVGEVSDYAEKLPASLAEIYAQNLDMWGTEMMLAREPIYPIKTYLEFESPAEEKEYDPISALVEMMGKVKLGETLALQILISPLMSNWYKPWMNILEKLKESKTEKKKPLTTVWDFSSGPLPVLTVGGGKEEGAQKQFTIRTPGETDVLKAVENNITKPAFSTIIRIFYMGPKPSFYFKFARYGILGVFNQYAALSLNSFMRNFRVSTEGKLDIKPYVFPTIRADHRKHRLLLNFKDRAGHPGTFAGKLISSTPFNFNAGGRPFPMNTECLATLFHPPTYLVLTAPHVRRVTSRKTGPPAGVAIFGEEKEIEKYE